MTIEQAQKAVDDWIKENGVRYFDKLTNLAMLTEEVGEVAREKIFIEKLVAQEY